MTKVVFKNLEASDLLHDAVVEKISNVTDKFPELKTHRICVTLEMHNSPTKPGPDEFSVGVDIQGVKYGGIRLSERGIQMYQAIGLLADSLLERLNRTGDKKRVVGLRQMRTLQKDIPTI